LLWRLIEKKKTRLQSKPETMWNVHGANVSLDIFFFYVERREIFHSFSLKRLKKKIFFLCIEISYGCVSSFTIFEYFFPIPMFFLNNCIVVICYRNLKARLLVCHHLEEIEHIETVTIVLAMTQAWVNLLSFQFTEVFFFIFIIL